MAVRARSMGRWAESGARSRARKRGGFEDATSPGGAERAPASPPRRRGLQEEEEEEEEK
jgi:hypothetical protein